jgi:hypothetical protein
MVGERGQRAAFTLSNGILNSTFFEARFFEFRPTGELIPATPPIAMVPPQGFLAAGGHQRLEMEWRGDAPTAGKVYMLFFDELPLSLDRTQSEGIRILLSLGAAVLVNPTGQDSAITATDIRQEGAGVWSFAFTNPGQRVIVLGRGRLEIARNEGSPTHIDGAALLTENRMTYLFPGETRRFSIRQDALSTDSVIRWQPAGQ